MYAVRFQGVTAFIKPFSAVKDELIYSQQFLSESTIAGIERKLFPELLNSPYKLHKIKRYRLSYSNMSLTMETTQAKGFNDYKFGDGRLYTTGKYKNGIVSILPLKRSILINPVLILFFENKKDAEECLFQHIHLCRNEDILFPESIEEVNNVDIENENLYPGFEMIFGKKPESFFVGYNRYNKNKEMYGYIKVYGQPVLGIERKK